MVKGCGLHKPALKLCGPVGQGTKVLPPHTPVTPSLGLTAAASNTLEDTMLLAVLTDGPYLSSYWTSSHWTHASDEFVENVMLHWQMLTILLNQTSFVGSLYCVNNIEYWINWIDFFFIWLQLYQPLSEQFNKLYHFQWFFFSCACFFPLCIIQSVRVFRLYCWHLNC